MKWLPSLGTFRGTILFAWVLLQILILGLVAVSSSQVTTRSLEDNLTYQIEQLTPLLNTALTAPLLQRDYASIIAIASEFAEAGNIAQVSVFDSEKNLITRAENSDFDQYALNNETVLVDIPLSFNKLQLGSATVKVSKLHLIQTKQKLVTITVVIFIAALILFFLIALHLSKDITKPITALASRVKNISKKDFKFKADRTRNDEIGDLESAFHAMSVEIRSKIQALNKSNEELEARVATRTSELRQVADQLAAQVKRLTLLAAVADNSHFAISIIDTSTDAYTIIYTNPAFSKITGVAQEDALGMKCRVFDHGIQDASADKIVNQAIESHSFCMVEFEDHRKNGEIFWNRLALFPVMIQANSPEYFVVYQSDITQYIRANTEREILLQQMQEGQKFESLGIMVAGLAHEINNPLGIALSAASHLVHTTDSLRSLKPGDQVDNTLVEFVEDEALALKMILDNLNRATALIDGFKEVAADKSIDIQKPIVLHEYLETIKQSLTPVLKNKKCKLNIDVDPTIRLVVNSGGLGQIISNLVINATVHAFADQRDRQIFIESVSDEKNIVLSIRDNGTGFAPDGINKAFTPFYTTRRSEGGTGLGLYISKQTAISKLQGDLSLDPEYSDGARFILTIPRSKMA